MPSDEQFTATGADDGSTLVGFQTDPDAIIERGVDVTGAKIGVIGTGTDFGVQARGTGNRSVGVDAEGRETGVIARAPGVRAGSVAVEAIGGSRGVRSQGNEVGMEGTGTIGVKGFGETGVDATGTEVGAAGKGPVGVQGNGAPGGRFISGDRQPQLHLKPHQIKQPGRDPVTPEEFTPPESELPKIGQLGDLWVTRHAGGPSRCILWLCVVPNGPKVNAAWAQVLLGTPIEGTMTPQDPPGEQG